MNDTLGIVSMFKSCLGGLITFVLILIIGIAIGYYKSGKDYDKGYKDGIKATKIVYETKIDTKP